GVGPRACPGSSVMVAARAATGGRPYGGTGVRRRRGRPPCLPWFVGDDCGTGGHGGPPLRGIGVRRRRGRPRACPDSSVMVAARAATGGRPYGRLLASVAVGAGPRACPD